MVPRTLVKFTLLLAVCTIGVCVPVKRNTVTEFDCKMLDVTRPKEIFNSRYYLENGFELCCPLDAICDVSNERAIEECADLGRKTTYEPCALCLTCAKNLGEECGGTQSIYGNCREGLDCIGNENKNQSGACAEIGDPVRQLGEACGGRFNSLGGCDSGLVCMEIKEGSNRVCVMGDRHQQWNESCGGRYGVLGRCDPEDDLSCSVKEEMFLKGQDVSGTCYGNTQKEPCFKDCSKKHDSYVCATDGVWYRHKCYYRQKNCGLREQDKIRKHWDESFCGELPTMEHVPPPSTESMEEEGEEETNTSSAQLATTEQSTLQGIEATSERVESND